MAAPSDRAIVVRDKLNALIKMIEGRDQESHVMRCCVAVAVEELEKWMYGGKYTPSVKPCEDGEFRIEVHEALEAKKLDWDVDYDDWPEEEKIFFQRGLRIAFIKAVRTRTHCGLKDAKEYYEAMKEKWPQMWDAVNKANRPPLWPTSGKVDDDLPF